MPSMIPQLPLRVLRLRVRYQAASTKLLPSGIANRLFTRWRGAFGRALRQTACPRPTEWICDSCPLRISCHYALFFEENLLPADSGIASPPRPYLLEIHPSPESIQSGDLLSFQLLLIGRATEAEVLEPLLPAFRLAGQLGLEAASPERLRLELVDILQQDGLNTAWWHPLADARRLIQQPTALEVVPPVAPHRVRLVFTTPLSLKHRGQRVGPRDFNTPLLLRRLSERIRRLAQLYEDPSRREVLSHLPEPRLPADFRVTAQDLSLRSFRHVSERHAPVFFSGLVGSLVIEGDLAEVWPWLWLGTWVHVGSETFIGLGQYHLTID